MQQPRAIAYCRVSDPRQVTEQGSLARQESEARDYARRKGYEITRVFVEPGHDAKTDRRPVLQEMMAFCKRGAANVDVLIVPKIDRFARQAEDYFALKHVLRRLLIRIESVGESIDETPVGRLSEGILASVAQFDNEIRAERCKDGMIDAVRSGRWAWKAPFGLRNVRSGEGISNAQPYEPEARLVRRAFELIDEGHLLPGEVFELMKTEGLGLTRSYFYTLLSNKLYIGIITAFGLEVRGVDPLIPIVDEDLFYRVQARLGRTFDSDSPDRLSMRLGISNPDFPLKETFLCECGQHLTGSWSAGKTKSYPYYHCNGCAKFRAGTTEIHEYFMELLDENAVTEEGFEKLRKHLHTMWSDRTALVETKREQASVELRKVTTTAGQLAQKNADGIIPDDIAKIEFERLAVKRAKLAGMLKQLQTPELHVDKAVAFAEGVLTHPSSYWSHSELPQQLQLQRAVLPTGLTIRKNKAVRTRVISVLKHVNDTLATPNPSWWTQGFLDRTLEFLQDFYARLSGEG